MSLVDLRKGSGERVLEEVSYLREEEPIGRTEGDPLK